MANQSLQWLIERTAEIRSNNEEVSNAEIASLIGVLAQGVADGVRSIKLSQ